MALILFYVRRFLAKIVVKVGIAPDWAQPVSPSLFGKESDPVLKCCMESMIRRHTAVTGE